MICPFLKGHRKFRLKKNLYLADFFFNLAGPSLIGSIMHDKSWLKEMEKKPNTIMYVTDNFASQ